ACVSRALTARGCWCVRHGKGQKDRGVPLSPALRAHWRQWQPTTWQLAGQTPRGQCSLRLAAEEGGRAAGRRELEKALARGEKEPYKRGEPMGDSERKSRARGRSGPDERFSPTVFSPSCPAHESLAEQPAGEAGHDGENTPESQIKRLTAAETDATPQKTPTA